MGGRASIILVFGFAVIMAYTTLNISRLTSRAAENMVGYNEITTSRNLANAGANIGLAMLTSQPYPTTRLLSTQSFTSGPFAGGGFTVRIDSLSSPARLRLRSVSNCTTYLKINEARTIPLVLNDTVEVRFDCETNTSFSTLGWMTVQEGNVFFITKDTLWGAVHSNSNIHISGSPVFWGQVTTSGRFDPKKNDAEFHGGKETGVEEKPFPNDISQVRDNATNDPATRTQELWVDLLPGTSADDDGYAIVRTGSYSGPQVDSIKLSDFSNNVIYSNQNVHVKGTLDGRLSIGSEKNVKLEGSAVYERRPDPTKLASDPANSTKDMLGLVANWNVQISADHHGDIEIHASVFARTESFEVENLLNRDVEGRIYLVGSIAQHDRGAVGMFSGSTLKRGYYKSYRYDPRLAESNADSYPPSFPGFPLPHTLEITNWWESNRVPLEVDRYY